MTLEVIYEDNHLLAVNKPVGLVVHSDWHHEQSLTDEVRAYLKEKYNKPHNAFAEAIHRLDKDASGIVVFAKTSKALARLMAAVRERQVEKHYLCLVEGNLEGQSQQLKHYLKKEEFRSACYLEPQEEAKEAKLSYDGLAHHEGKSLLAVDLETGRYHQIRAQLSASGYPIVGDSKYGSELPGPLFLHHSQMVLPHPITKAPLSLKAALPGRWPEWSKPFQS